MGENRTGDGLNEELAEVAFDLARGYCTGAKAYKAALHFVQTSGGAAQVFFKALEDGKIDEVEYESIKKWLSKLAEAITLMQQAFDEMPISKTSEDASDDLA